jgi:hypothetical protein
MRDAILVRRAIRRGNLPANGPHPIEGPREVPVHDASERLERLAVARAANSARPMKRS